MQKPRCIVDSSCSSGDRTDNRIGTDVRSRLDDGQWGRIRLHGQTENCHHPHSGEWLQCHTGYVGLRHLICTPTARDTLPCDRLKHYIVVLWVLWDYVLSIGPHEILLPQHSAAPCDRVRVRYCLRPVLCSCRCYETMTCFGPSWSALSIAETCQTLRLVFVQLLSLLRDYDLLWPKLSMKIMVLADAANLGIAVTAPRCYWPSFGFYENWRFTMLLPVRSIVLRPACFFRSTTGTATASSSYTARTACILRNV